MSTCCCIATVKTAEIGVVERCGKFSAVKNAGMSCFCYPIECLVDRVSTRVCELHNRCETKTKDNVFVVVSCSVQYQVIREKVFEAYYLLDDVEAQMRAYVYDVIRAHIPKMGLDDAFAAKEDLSMAVKTHLGEVMEKFGFQILTALVTDLTPDNKVRDAMNEINASRRQKEAAYQKAEGDKIIKVKKAEAESESMYLSGVGVAKQRKAIMDGLRESIVSFSEGGVANTKDVMDLLVLNQYFDTLNEIGGTAGAKIIFQDSTKHPITEGVLQANASLGY
jgi:regulator of protease activity HflC (stomatin/prohibitin superfamily)